ARRADASLTFVGSVGGFERPLLAETDLPFEHQDEVRAGPLHGVSPIKMVGSMIQLAIGSLQAVSLIRRRKPDVILLTGGWVGLPVALAGWLLRVPSLIYLPDIEPGLAIRMLRRIVTRVAVTAAESQQYFRAGQTIVTGYPTRESLTDATRTEAIRHFGLDPARKTLLVWGGSRGARTINNALLAILPDLLADGVQVIHVTGTLDWDELQKQIAAIQRDQPEAMRHYHPFPYLHDDVGLALAAADLTVSRAGASVLGEYPLFALPSILVPYPYAWRYQKVNADYLAERGAAVVLRDEDMAVQLAPTIRSVLGARLEDMKRRAAALNVPDGAWNVARALIDLARG
ncbi:MAG: UDP-N-acetylglucosamine--N-acetylmuramyl-(pentapeptide) pyrophosphoryl-undecaprenol N-acetylglucosamine transferase, partial [Anaerolinea sp.]|nr:UDP-N-acetylglucosamine--N-acetylmuramyl-(pentapeptide) pyrophosphoryl-undecaprenol N-acetylglucosamine transferase [Anaerolinea sp.]